MSIFSKKEKSASSDYSHQQSDKNTTSDDLQEVLKRLSSYAGYTINMLKKVLATDKGLNYNTLLLYAAGLAGHACQRAVIANNDKCADVGMKDGRHYYFGDGVNAYLLENRGSVLSFMNGIYVHITGRQPSDQTPMIKNTASLVGDDNYKIWNAYSPDDVYNMIKNCWDGIFENMTGRYCKTPSEWPIFFGIVLQNIMIDGMNNGREDEVYNMTLECILFISKMRDESLAKK